jgi:hypothetical protein
MTAVEWLKEKWYSDERITDETFEQAKEMEKQQIIYFADKYDAYVVQGGDMTAEQYYNETFKKK